MTVLFALLLAATGPQDSFDALRDLPVASGSWVYAGGAARFSPYVSVRCEPTTGRVQLIAPGFTSVATDSASVIIPAGGWFAARDARLDAIAFSRARFILKGEAGRPPVAIPVRPELARSIEDCRN